MRGDLNIKTHMVFLLSIILILPRHEIGLGEHLTKSTPILLPVTRASEAATTVRPWTETLMLMFMVMQTLYISVLTVSARWISGLRAAFAAREKWEGELRIAATLIPALLWKRLLPFELSRGGL